jgi:pSer/pThr/pTyr-binding forkhead associated (FHA) protein
MAKLILKYEAAVLKEVNVGVEPLTIGRAPDNDIQVDNLAVSSHHAKIVNEAGKLVVEDLNSMNGTFVNNQRVKRITLKPGDIVLVGKHTIEVRGEADVPPLHAAAAAPKAVMPKMEETMVLDTKKRREMLAGAHAAGEGTQQMPDRVRIPTLVVLSGKTDQSEYLLTNKLTVIGKSEMATVRLKGWFAPKVAAQINKRDDGYYIGTADKVPVINGQPIHGPTRLSDGDTIELGKVKLSFVYKD